MLATTSLPGQGAGEFLTAAVAFCNNVLHGTLGATIIAHPRTIKALGDEIEQAIDDLHYGTVALNSWHGAAFLVTQAAWGAPAGHRLDDVQSGIGVVHNTLCWKTHRKMSSVRRLRPSRAAF